VESLTALAEYADGRLEIIDWAEQMRQPQAVGAGAQAALRPVVTSTVTDLS